LQRVAYSARITASASLEDRLRELARVRTEEGCMAEVRRDGDGYLFVEKHSPIHVAASACPGLSSSELDLFRSVVGPRVEIEQIEHIVAGGRRSVYRVKSAST
jgi:predicted ArsR family transcriptional regulator